MQMRRFFQLDRLIMGLVASVMISSPLWADMTVPVTVISPPPFLESPGATAVVEFDVHNTTGQTLALDWALAVIYGPPDLDDNVFFDSVTFPTGIPAGKTGEFLYTVDNTFGDPTDNDGPGGGTNFVTFQVGLSPAAGGCVPQNLTAPAPGLVFFNSTCPPAGAGPDAAVMTKLENCFANPGPFPNPCPIGPGDNLFTGEYHGDPNPAIGIVTVTDTPEPSTLLGGVGCALILTGATWRRRKRAA